MFLPQSGWNQHSIIGFQMSADGKWSYPAFNLTRTEFTCCSCAANLWVYLLLRLPSRCWAELQFLHSFAQGLQISSERQVRVINMARTCRWGIRRTQAPLVTVPCFGEKCLAGCHQQLLQERHHKVRQPSGSQMFPLQGHVLLLYCIFQPCLCHILPWNSSRVWELSLSAKPHEGGTSWPWGQAQRPVRGWRIPTDNTHYYNIFKWCRQPRTIPPG